MFVLEKKITMEVFGEQWKDCYLKFQSPTFGQIKSILKDDGQAVDQGIELLKSLYIDGNGWNGGEVVPINKEDITELPIQILNHCFSELAGEINPKFQGD